MYSHCLVIYVLPTVLHGSTVKVCFMFISCIIILQKTDHTWYYICSFLILDIRNQLANPVCSTVSSFV